MDYVHNTQHVHHNKHFTLSSRDANSALFGGCRFFHGCLGDLCELCRSDELLFFFGGGGGVWEGLRVCL